MLANKCDSESVDQVRQVVNERHTKLPIVVPFPIYKSSDMGDKEQWTELISIDIKERTAFMGDPELNPQCIPGNYCSYCHKSGFYLKIVLTISKTLLCMMSFLRFS